MKKAFTLAEVLITIGIIGVVAAVTMPTLVKNYQQNTTVNKLKQSYALLSQAVQLSELENGSVTEWEYPLHNAESIKEFLNKYVTPYIKYTKIETENNLVYLYLNNGTIIRFHNNADNETVLQMNVYLNGKDNAIKGKNQFVLYLGYYDSSNLPNNCNSRIYKCQKNGVFFYDYLGFDTTEYNSAHEALTANRGKYACYKNSAYKTACGALIMNDGWKIEKDYPW